MGYSNSSSKREVHSAKCLSQETRKVSNNLTLYLKGLKREQTKPKFSRRKEITNIRAEINKIETKEKIEKINVRKQLHLQLHQREQNT